MWKLDLPDATTAPDELRTAFKVKKARKLVYQLSEAQVDQIVDLYQQYDEECGRGRPRFKTGGLANDLQQALYNAYVQVQKRRRLAGLRARLFAAADRCPMCRIGPVTDLDHHLPRSTYRLFSIYARNLVPCCGTCNGAKHEAGAKRNDEFVHPYFVTFPDGRFLNAECSLEDGALITQFGVTQLDGVDDDLYARMVAQFERLQLAERYRGEIVIFLCTMAQGFSDAYGTDKNPGRVAEWVARNARSLENSLGINDWRPVLLHAISRSIEFCDGGFVSALGRKRDMLE